MSIRRLSTTSITSTGGKSSKLWDQETTLGTFESIAAATADASGSATITFSNIPQNYTHLQVRYVAQSNRALYVDNLEMYVNGDQGTNYSAHYMITDGVNVPSSTGGGDSTGFLTTTQCLGSSTNNANYFGAGIIDILNYSSTSQNKTLRASWGLNLNSPDTSGSYGRLGFSGGSWRNNTTGITSITFFPTLGSLLTQNSKFALYGIRGA